MVDNVLINKAATIERCIKRVREEYTAAGSHFADDFTRQDSVVLNIQRACEAALDMGQYIIRRDSPGIPQGARDVFNLLQQAGIIDAEQATSLKNMVGFRNVAVHDYQALLIPILISIINSRLDDLSGFAQRVLQAKA